jgi:hypothetical protein
VNTRLTRFFVSIVRASGLAIIVVGVLLGALVWLVPSDTFTILGGARPGQAVAVRFVWTISFVVAGLLAGAPFIVFGQLVLVFLDMRRRLVRIDGRLRRRWEIEREPESPQAERLQHRRPGL